MPESRHSEDPEIGEQQVASARKNEYDDADYELPPAPAVSNDQPAAQYDNNQGANDEEFDFE